MRRIAELRLKYILDKNTNIRTAREEGREEGIKIEQQKRIYIIKNLLKLKIPKEQISEATGLSIEEIEKL